MPDGFPGSVAGSVSGSLTVRGSRGLRCSVREFAPAFVAKKRVRRVPSYLERTDVGPVWPSEEYSRRGVMMPMPKDTWLGLIKVDHRNP